MLLFLIPILIGIAVLALNALPYMHGARYAGLKKIKDKSQMRFGEALADLFVSGLVGAILSSFLGGTLGAIASLLMIFWFLKSRYNPTGKQYAIVFAALILGGVILAFIGQLVAGLIMGAVFSGIGAIN